MKKLLTKMRSGPQATIGTDKDLQGSQELHQPPRVLSDTQNMRISSAQLGSQKATLEGLASEIQINILQQLSDVTSLRSLVHAVPSYHSAYVSRRCFILKSVLAGSIERELLVDAHSVIDALDIIRDCSNDAPAHEVRSFLEQHRVRRSSESMDFPAIPSEKLFLLARLESSVQSVTSSFIESRLSACPSGEQINFHHETVSANESRRVRRALYRLELFCVLFGRSAFGRPGKSYNYSIKQSNSFESTDEGVQFFAVFTPWEIEEIACVRDYAIEHYKSLYEVHWQELNVRMIGNFGTSASSFLELDEVMIPEFAEVCMSRGLSFLRDVMSFSTTEQIAMLRENRKETFGFLTMCLEDYPYDYVHRTAQYDRWVDGTDLPFTSDNGGPNAAWTWANDNKPEIYYFREETEPLRKWAYVMWDKERLDRWGILEEDNQPYVREFNY